VFSDLILLIYNNQSIPILKFTFKDAFPIAVGDLPLSSAETGSVAPLSTADFMYRSYDIETL
jgi:hypothetical protein